MIRVKTMHPECPLQAQQRAGDAAVQGKGGERTDSQPADCEQAHGGLFAKEHGPDLIYGQKGQRSRGESQRHHKQRDRAIKLGMIQPFTAAGAGLFVLPRADACNRGSRPASHATLPAATGAAD